MANNGTKQWNMATNLCDELQIKDETSQWLRDHLVDEERLGYAKMDVVNWQIKAVMQGQLEWRFKILAKYKTM